MKGTWWHSTAALQQPLSHLSTAQWEQRTKDRQYWRLWSCWFPMGNLGIRTRSPRKRLLQKCAISDISKWWEDVCPETWSTVTDQAKTLAIWHPMGWNLAELVSPALRTFQILHGQSELNSLNSHSNHGFNPALPPQLD